MVAKVIDMMDSKLELMQNTGSTLCDVVVVISACHGYGYTHGFHMGLAVGMGTGTRFPTRQKPIPIPIVPGQGFIVWCCHH
jgi:hypothetical protein